eukprot:4550383-Ditylum_brightwellii.AAC.2
MVIDLNMWIKSTRAPRNEFCVDSFSADGRERRGRAILECKRRLFGNDGEEIMDIEYAHARMKLSKQKGCFAPISKNLFAKGCNA